MEKQNTIHHQQELAGGKIKQKCRLQLWSLVMTEEDERLHCLLMVQKYREKYETQILLDGKQNQKTYRHVLVLKMELGKLFVKKMILSLSLGWY